MYQKVSLITGTSFGVGKAMAERLVRDGYTVYGAAQRVENTQGLEMAGGHALRLNATNED